MINKKFYSDIKRFPSQFGKALNFAKDIKIESRFDQVVLCGMGGSSLYADLINNILRSYSSKFEIKVVRDYSIPSFSNKNTLFIVSSYSGNTEETLSCFDQILSKGLNSVIITSGGNLLKQAKVNKIPFIKIPGGIQPRLSTGYFIGGVLKVLFNHGFIDQKIIDDIIKIEYKIDENYAKRIAKRLVGKVPVVYATDNNWSIARITKIKFNENSKVQSYWNFFPELNHNEMVGYTNMVMKPFFLIFVSKFTHKQNMKRIKAFEKIFKEKGLEVELIKSFGRNNSEEMFNFYYLADYIAFYLAEEYEIDPEPVRMVEKFKKMI